MITLAQAKKIAATIDSDTVITQSNERGWFFINPADMHSFSDASCHLFELSGTIG
jgi:hypothetical protein